MKKTERKEKVQPISEGRKDGWMEGRKEERMNEGWMDGLMDGWIEGRKEERMDGWKDRRKEERMDGWMEG